MTLSALLTRLETATEADQAKLLEMAFDVFLPKPKDIWLDDQRKDWTPEYTAWQALGWKAGNMIQADAYIDASLLIMREVLPGWGYDLEQERPSCPCSVSLSPPGSDPWGTGSFDANGAELSLAIIAAVCAAKGE